MQFRKFQFSDQHFFSVIFFYCFCPQRDLSISFRHSNLLDNHFYYPQNPIHNLESLEMLPFIPGVSNLCLLYFFSLRVWVEIQQFDNFCQKTNFGSLKSILEVLGREENGLATNLHNSMLRILMICERDTRKRSFCSHFVQFESMISAFKFNMEEKYITL